MGHLEQQFETEEEEFLEDLKKFVYDEYHEKWNEETMSIQRIIPFNTLRRNKNSNLPDGFVWKH